MREQQNCQDPLKVLGRFRGYSKKEIIKKLPRHADFSLYLITQLKNMPEVILRNSGSPFAKKIMGMMREISKESYRAIQFTRTEINDRGVLYGVVSLRHKVMNSILKYFHKRWPQCIVCLYNEQNGMTGIIDEKGRINEIKLLLHEVVEIASKNRTIVPYFEDIQFSGEEIFETLYNSQSIKGRENKRYFKSMIPDYCFKLPGMRNGVEKRYNPKYVNLDSFFKNK